MKTGTFAFSLEKREDEVRAWVEKYLLYLADTRGFSKGTIYGQSRNLTRFVSYLENAGLAESQVTQEIVERYALSLHNYRRKDGTPYRPMTIRSLLSTLRQFFRYAYRQNWMLVNPARNLPLPRKGKLLPRVVFSETEMEKILQQPDALTPYGLRDRAILETFYSTGMRKSELLNLRVNDIDFERGVVHIRAGKGMKDRVVPIGERAMQWIEKYLSHNKVYRMPGIENLFVTNHGTPLMHAWLGFRVVRYIESAELGKMGGCHSFRHTCATLMLSRGASVRHVQEMLGHTNTETTQIYTRVTIPELKEMFRRYHPFYLYDETPSPVSLRTLLADYIGSLTGKAAPTVNTLRVRLLHFVDYAKNQQETTEPAQLTPEILAAYQAYVNTLEIGRDHAVALLTRLADFLAYLRARSFAVPEFQFTYKPAKARKVIPRPQANKTPRTRGKQHELQSEHLRKYINYLKLNGFKPHTTDRAEIYVRHFLSFLAENSVVRIEEVTPAMVEAYQSFLTEDKNIWGELRTVEERHRRAAIVADFMKFLYNSNMLLTNPAEDMELPRLPHRLPMGILSAEEIQRILALPDLDPEQAFSYRWKKVACQTRAIVELFLATGIRRAELAGLRMADLNRAGMTLLIREGKGAKDRMVPMTPRAFYWLDQYLGFLGTPKTGEAYIFEGRKKGEPLSMEGLHNAISRIFRKAGIERHGTCHLFRHTLATMLLDNGAELRHIQEVLGHESISSTDTYTHVSIGKLKEVHTATHPTANLRQTA